MKHEFDPDAAAPPESGVFGLSHDERTAEALILPVPFDATTSYRKGAARGPEAVLRASKQVELFDPVFGKPYEHGIAMLEPDPRVPRLNAEASDKAERIIALGGDLKGDAFLARDLARVNAIGAEVNEIVHAWTARALAEKKLPAILGGDHSVPFGSIQACAERHPGLGVLHFDAHADLRDAYEGFSWSHASIMHNVVRRLDTVAKLVQVGIRDFGEREHELIAGSKGRIRAVFDSELARARLEGGATRDLVRRAIDELPREVYVSFDVDAFDPTLAPNTGTPVPGGLSWHDAMLWLEELARSGKRVVGLDLNEVSPGETSPEVDSWDAIVGARLLYRLIGAAQRTRHA